MIDEAAAAPKKPRKHCSTSIDAETQAIAACYAALKDLPNDDAIERVIDYVKDRLTNETT